MSDHGSESGYSGEAQSEKQILSKPALKGLPDDTRIKTYQDMPDLFGKGAKGVESKETGSDSVTLDPVLPKDHDGTAASVIGSSPEKSAGDAKPEPQVATDNQAPSDPVSEKERAPLHSADGVAPSPSVDSRLPQASSAMSSAPESSGVGEVQRSSRALADSSPASNPVQAGDSAVQSIPSGQANSPTNFRNETEVAQSSRPAGQNVPSNEPPVLRSESSSGNVQQGFETQPPPLAHVEAPHTNVANISETNTSASVVQTTNDSQSGLIQTNTLAGFPKLVLASESNPSPESISAVSASIIPASQNKSSQESTNLTLGSQNTSRQESTGLGLGAESKQSQDSAKSVLASMKTNDPANLLSSRSDVSEIGKAERAAKSSVANTIESGALPAGTSSRESSIGLDDGKTSARAGAVRPDVEGGSRQSTISLDDGKSTGQPMGGKRLDGDSGQRDGGAARVLPDRINSSPEPLDSYGAVRQSDLVGKRLDESGSGAAGGARGTTIKSDKGSNSGNSSNSRNPYSSRSDTETATSDRGGSDIAKARGGDNGQGKTSKFVGTKSGAQPSRVESSSLDEPGRRDDTGGHGARGDKGRIDAGNDGRNPVTEIASGSRREPLIIPGVIINKTEKSRNENQQPDEGKTQTGGTKKSAKARGLDEIKKVDEIKRADWIKKSESVKNQEALGLPIARRQDSTKMEPAKAQSIKVDEISRKDGRPESNKGIISTMANAIAGGIANIKDKFVPVGKHESDQRSTAAGKADRSDRATDRSTDRSIGRSSDKSGDRSTERSPDRSTNRSPDRSADRSTDRSTDRPRRSGQGRQRMPILE